jgi:hypothetical protein
MQQLGIIESTLSFSSLQVSGEIVGYLASGQIIAGLLPVDFGY